MRNVILILVALCILFSCKKTPPADVGASLSLPASATAAQALPAGVADTLRKNFERVHFATDSATLDAASRDALTANAALLREYSAVVVRIDGHADERGTSEYNLALAERRAQAVRSWLTTQGIAASRLPSVSFGEERPLVAASGEDAWSQNRRVDFFVVDGAGAPIVGTTTQ